ncbi:MAG: NADH-quinone oxidoreductase subunit H [Deltaproteobacteria bacterium]|nr:NADH-quinone oxidoreductase subunit H [Deltaproteobacteria bacterium]
MHTALVLLLAAVKAGAILAAAMTAGALLTLVERRLSAMIQDRVGPNRADVTLAGRRFTMGGLLHPMADGVKMLFKEDFIPEGANRFIFVLAPFVVMFFTLATFSVIPFGDVLDLSAIGLGLVPLQIADLNVGLLFAMAVASLAIYGTVLAGWSSNNKFSLLGGMRAASQLVAYEAVMGLCLVGAVMVFGTASLKGIVDAQAGTVLGFLPRWGVFVQPLAFLIFIVAAIAESKRVPFDIPEGESEIIGYFIEYSGLKFAMFFLGEFIEVALAAIMMTVVFFGGWHIPWVDPANYGTAAPWVIGIAGLAGVFAGAVAAWGHGSRLMGAVIALGGCGAVCAAGALAFAPLPGWIAGCGVAAAQVLVFVGKAAVLTWLQFMVRWTLPRFRFDQLLAIGWKKLVPWSLANIVLTGAVLLWVTS